MTKKTGVRGLKRKFDGWVDANISTLLRKVGKTDVGPGVGGAGSKISEERNEVGRKEGKQRWMQGRV